MGSFVNALVWRVRSKELIHEAIDELQAKKPSAKSQKQISQLTQDMAGLSIMHGRSMCPNCKQTLDWYDLIPVFSWLSVRGRCRYCHKPISSEYPIVEIATAALFVISYISWPHTIKGIEIVVFGLWLLILTGLMALTVYDLHWRLLPNKIVFPLLGLGVVQAGFIIFQSTTPLKAVINSLIALAIGGGIFFALYQISDGKWIGGGDVKLGWLLGLLAATPALSLLVIFLSSLLGTLVALPGLVLGRLRPKSEIPYGPFLFAAAIIVVLYGPTIFRYYERLFLIV